MGLGCSGWPVERHQILLGSTWSKIPWGLSELDRQRGHLAKGWASDSAICLAVLWDFPSSDSKNGGVCSAG